MAEFEDLDENLDGVGEVQLVVSEEKDPDKPFWRLSKTEFLPLLRIIDSIASRNSDAVSRSILLWENEGNLFYSMTNRDVYLRGKLALKNQQNILKEKLILSSKQLLEVARFSADMVLYKEEDQMFASVMRGKYPLEIFTFSESIYQADQGEKVLATSEEIDMATVKVDFDLFVRLMAQAALAEDRKIVVKGGFAYGNFVSILARKNVSYPDMVVTGLTAKDVAALTTVYSANIKVAVSASRVAFVSENFQYSSVSLKGEVSKEVAERFEEENKGFLVDGNQLFNLFSFLALSTNDSSIVDVRAGKEGMKMYSRTKSGKVSEFAVIDLPVEPMQFKMQVVSAKKVFSVLKFFSSVLLEKRGDCLSFEGDGLKMVLSIRG